MKLFQKTIVKVIFILLAAALLLPVGACRKTKIVTGELPPGYVPNIGGKVKVSCINHLYQTEESRRGIMSWINAFCQEHPNVQVQTEFNLSDYAPLIASKTLGDVFYISDGGLGPNDTLYQYAITNKAMMPLDFYIEALGIDLTELYGGILDLCYVEGRMYMVGMTCGNVIFTYDVDKMVEAGVIEPGETLANDWTWEDFKNACEAVKLYEDDNQTLAQVGCAYSFNWQNMYSPFLYAYGGRWYDKVEKRVNLTSDAVMKGISEAIELIDRRLAYPVGVNMGAALVKEYGNVRQYSGCVLNFNESYTVLTARVKQYPRGTEWDVVPYPLFENPASPCGALGFSVFSYTKNSDTAAALALFLLTEEGQRAVHSQAGGDVPILKKLGDDDFWHLKGDGYDGKNYTAFTANYENYVPGQLATCVPPEVAIVVHEGINKLFNNYCTNGASWTDILAETQEKANQLWETIYVVE